MTETNKAALESARDALSAAFKRARQEHRDAALDVKAKRDACNKFPAVVPALDYKMLAQRELARGEFNDAQRDALRRVENAWATFAAEARKIRAELESEAADGVTMNPKSVDQAGITLLQSGLMKAADYAGMAETYSGNPTMERLLLKYAQEYAATLTDMNDAGERYQLQEVIGELLEDPLAKYDAFFDGACQLAHISADGNLFSMGDAYSEPVSADAWEMILGQAP